MKQKIFEFCRRGVAACGFGPLILAAVYLISYRLNGIETLTVREVCMGIFSLSALAFIVGGMNIIYQIERLPLMVAILIHGGVLYVSYLATYLLNDWLEQGRIPFLVFSGVFVLGYLIIWAIIYSAIKRNTEKINRILKEKQWGAADL